MNKHLGAKKRPAKPVRSTGARKASPRKARARVTAKKHEPRNGRKVAVRSVAPANLPKVSPGVIGSAGASIATIGAGSGASINVSQVRLTRASTSQLSIRAMNVSAVAAIGEALRSHKFQVGQTVSYTSSPISRPGASGSYKVVRLLPSDGEDYQYRIKHAGEAFERVAKESQLEIEG
jgi:hypothetical protein